MAAASGAGAACAPRPGGAFVLLSRSSSRWAPQAAGAPENVRQVEQGRAVYPGLRAVAERGHRKVLSAVEGLDQGGRGKKKADEQAELANQRAIMDFDPTDLD